MPSLTFTNTLPSRSLMKDFELQHPYALQWGALLKTKVYYSVFSYFAYLNVDNVVVGELILGWEDNKTVNIDSITILPEHQGKGYGKVILRHALQWAKEQFFVKMTAATRQPISVSLFKSMGFTQVGIFEDWGGTGEDYADVEINL